MMFKLPTFIDLGIPALSTFTSFKDKYSDREVERRREVESYKQLVGKEDYYSANSKSNLPVLVSYSLLRPFQT